jgi:hypothetical protein
VEIGDHETYIDANPYSEYRVCGIPLLEPCSLCTLQVQVDLIDEREHCRSEWRYELCISRCATARKVVRVHWAGVELRDVIADPVRASRRSPAWECRITEWVR